MSEATFTTGLKELLEYVEFAQNDDGYLTDQDIGLHGLLLTDSVETSSDSPDRGITHLTAGQLMVDDFPKGWIPDPIRAGSSI